MKTTGLLLALVLVSTAIAQAGDYYVYTDAAGRTWLSNQDPRNNIAETLSRREYVPARYGAIRRDIVLTTG